MNFIKSLAKELGVFLAICSRNDLGKIKLAFDSIDESIFPLKNEIDCIVANYNDKSENIEAIAKQLSILPDSIVFIDDNILIRDEVRQRLPNVFVPNWAEYSDLTTQLIVACIFERNELSMNSRDRRKQYEILQLERKKNEKQKTEDLMLIWYVLMVLECFLVVAVYLHKILKNKDKSI